MFYVVGYGKKLDVCGVRIIYPIVLDMGNLVSANYCQIQGRVQRKVGM